jgi:3-oxoacyl-[acyl-carrier protein] reductase
MDLNIEGRSAIVCGSSRGLGKACAVALCKEGVNVWISARTKADLQKAAAEIEAAGRGRVQSVVADVTSDDGRSSLLSACPAPDILINNAGGPPPGDFRDWTQQDWFDAVNSNMYSAIDMIKRTIDGMVERRFGRIVNITSIAVKQPLPDLGLSNAARSGLTGFVSGLARQVTEHNVTINNLLPGYCATDRMNAILKTRAKSADESIDDAIKDFLTVIPARRLGQPDEFGAACAFLCSEHAAYFTAQNFLMDGGAYPGTL